MSQGHPGTNPHRHHEMAVYIMFCVYYLWFQAFIGDLGMYPQRTRGDHCFVLSVSSKWSLSESKGPRQSLNATGFHYGKMEVT